MPERHAHYRYRSGLPLLVSAMVACSGTNNPSNDASTATASTATASTATASTATTSNIAGVTDDTTVPVAQSQSLNDQLQQAGADADLHLVEGAGHGFSSPSSAWPDAESAIFEFLTAQGILP